MPAPSSSAEPPTPRRSPSTASRSWWRTQGRNHYPQAQSLQILADGGGSNSSTARAWKFNLQHRLCNRHGLRVTVAHYPPATSKWNPIEHRLFCEISKNWAGRPLDSYETILNYLRTTRTSTGLRVRAHLVRKTYKTGVKVTTPNARAAHHTEQRHAEMELHHRTHLAKKRNLFLRRPGDCQESEIRRSIINGVVATGARTLFLPQTSWSSSGSGNRAPHA